MQPPHLYESSYHVRHRPFLARSRLHGGSRKPGDTATTTCLRARSSTCYRTSSGETRARDRTCGGVTVTGTRCQSTGASANACACACRSGIDGQFRA